MSCIRRTAVLLALVGAGACGGGSSTTTPPATAPPAAGATTTIHSGMVGVIDRARQVQQQQNRQTQDEQHTVDQLQP